MEQELEFESQQVAAEQDEQVSPHSPSQAASSHNAAAETESETEKRESHAHDKPKSAALKTALQNRFVVGKAGLFSAWHRAAYHEEVEARAAISQVEDFPKSPAKLLAGVTEQRLKMQNYLTKECEFHMESTRKVGNGRNSSLHVHVQLLA